MTSLEPAATEIERMAREFIDALGLHVPPPPLAAPVCDQFVY
jgi:hypothetical protein